MADFCFVDPFRSVLNLSLSAVFQMVMLVIVIGHSSTCPGLFPSQPQEIFSLRLGCEHSLEGWADSYSTSIERGLSGSVLKLPRSSTLSLNHASPSALLSPHKMNMEKGKGRKSHTAAFLRPWQWPWLVFSICKEVQFSRMLLKEKAVPPGRTVAI